MLKLIFSLFLVATSFMSFGADFVAGQDYEIIKNALPSHSKNVAHVTEFFSYGCHWCYNLEPAVARWVGQQGTKITFEKIPVIFNPDWEFYAKAYYTAHALSMNAKFNPILFKAILDDKQTLNTNQAMSDFFIKNGVESSVANSAFNHSPSIDLDIANSKRLMGEYHIAAVPAFVVNNQFKTDLQMAKTEKHLFEILNFLLTK